MSVRVLNSLDDFKGIISTNKLVAIDAWATWCGPCRAISPIFEKLASQFPNITFAKVDVDEVPDVSQELGVRAMPAFFFFVDGSKIEDMIGANPPALTAAVNKLNAAS